MEKLPLFFAALLPLHWRSGNSKVKESFDSAVFQNRLFLSTTASGDLAFSSSAAIMIGSPFFILIVIFSASAVFGSVDKSWLCKADNKTEVSFDFL